MHDPSDFVKANLSSELSSLTQSLVKLIFSKGFFVLKKRNLHQIDDSILRPGLGIKRILCDMNFDLSLRLSLNLLDFQSFHIIKH